MSTKYKERAEYRTREILIKVQSINNWIKENPNFNIPTIALTADAVAGAREKYLSEGFIDYIAKPFNKDQIKEKLDIVFKDRNDTSQGSNETEIKNEEPVEVKTENPKYDPNIDRFKDVPAYVVGSDDDK